MHNECVSRVIHSNRAAPHSNFIISSGVLVSRRRRRTHTAASLVTFFVEYSLLDHFFDALIEIFSLPTTFLGAFEPRTFVMDDLTVAHFTLPWRWMTHCLARSFHLFFFFLARLSWSNLPDTMPAVGRILTSSFIFLLPHNVSFDCASDWPLITREKSSSARRISETNNKKMLKKLSNRKKITT